MCGNVIRNFLLKDIPRKQLTDDLKNTLVIVTDTFAALSKDDLEKDFPIPLNNKISPTGFILIYLLGTF